MIGPIDNSRPIAGSATVTEDDMNGVMNELTEAITRTAFSVDCMGFDSMVNWYLHHPDTKEVVRCQQRVQIPGDIGNESIEESLESEGEAAQAAVELSKLGHVQR